MPDYLYPTQADGGREWVKDMLIGWRSSHLPYLCFPFMTFKVHTLRNTPFWMYMYYRQNSTDIASLIGKVKFRIHIIDWSYEKYNRADAYFTDFGGGETTWFLCDKAEEIALLSISDFEHVDANTGIADGKLLSSAIHSSISPVVFRSSIQTMELYP